ncbi:MAG: hypothetical protein U9N14_04745 [Pseudomonadota bacterium]|nr:hypothetical protein [Pseudomonadota bacterium]
MMKNHNKCTTADNKPARVRGFMKGVVRGAGAAACIHNVPIPSSSDVYALHADWKRIGSDFEVAIKKISGDTK